MEIRRLPDVLRVRAAMSPDRIAHDDTGERMTFAEWDRAADEIGGGLAAAGIGSGQRVLLPITNRHATAMAATYMGVLRAGAICVPVNTRLAVPEVEQFRALVGADVAITDVPELAGQIALQRVFTLDDVPRDASAVPDQRSFDTGDADILSTSGTTGRPKGVVFSHGELVDGLDGVDDTQATTMLHALPFTGFGGCHGIMLLPLRYGTTIITQPKFDPDGFFQLIAEKEPTSLHLVPAMLRLLLDRFESVTADLSSVRWIFTGTAPLPTDSARRLAELWPQVRLINVYGMTEGSTSVQTSGRTAVSKPGAVGTSREAGSVEVRDDDGAPCPAGVVGEVWTRVRHERRYWGNPEATAATWQDGWLRTGDRGYVDEDGDLILVGRSKELIIRGGYNIAPIEVEDVLHAHPAVLDAAVVGVPHDVLGEEVAAAVVVRPGMSVSEAELVEWCRARLAENKVPRAIELVAELPYNQNAKVMKRDLVPALSAAVDARRGVSPAER